MFAERMERLRSRLAEADIDVALITDDDSVYYFTGFYDYLHMKFGLPTILAVSRDGGSLLITPSMEMDMAEAAALSVIRPGVKAEEVHTAYAEVIQSAGYEYPFRCGRGTGFSFLENPQLVFGEKSFCNPEWCLP